MRRLGILFGFVVDVFAWLCWIIVPSVLLERWPPDTFLWWVGAALAVIYGLATLAVTHWLILAWRGANIPTGPLLRTTLSIAACNFILAALAGFAGGHRVDPGILMAAYVLILFTTIYAFRTAKLWIEWLLSQTPTT